MAKYRTAQGRTLDMAALAARHERTRAVGNMSVNARGDTIDSTGKVIVPVTKKVGDKYQKTVSNRAANIVKSKQAPLKPVETAPKPEQKVDLTPEELELESSYEDDIEVETIKSKDNNR